jgi:hypothetical protein
MWQLTFRAIPEEVSHLECVTEAYRGRSCDCTDSSPDADSKASHSPSEPVSTSLSTVLISTKVYAALMTS